MVQILETYMMETRFLKCMEREVIEVINEDNYFTKKIKKQRKRRESFATKGKISVSKNLNSLFHLKLKNNFFIDYINLKSVVLTFSLFSTLPISKSFPKWCEFFLGSSFHICPSCHSTGMYLLKLPYVNFYNNFTSSPCSSALITWNTFTICSQCSSTA